MVGLLEAGDEAVAEDGFLVDVVDDHGDEGVALKVTPHLLKVGVFAL